MSREMERALREDAKKLEALTGRIHDERILECDECFHSLALHGPEGCTRYRTRQIEGSSETETGPCGCRAYEMEDKQ